MRFKKNIKRAENSNYIDVYVNRDVGNEMNKSTFFEAFEETFPLLTKVMLCFYHYMLNFYQYIYIF